MRSVWLARAFLAAGYGGQICTRLALNNLNHLLSLSLYGVCFGLQAVADGPSVGGGRRRGRRSQKHKQHQRTAAQASQLVILVELMCKL